MVATEIQYFRFKEKTEVFVASLCGSFTLSCEELSGFPVLAKSGEFVSLPTGFMIAFDPLVAF
jgi:hypothetical protein